MQDEFEIIFWVCRDWEEEFVLKQSDVDNYNEKDIRKSFQFSKTEEK